MIYKTLRKYPSLAFFLDGGFYLGSIILLYLVLQKVQLPLVYWPLTFNLLIPLFYFYKHFFRTSRNEQATSLSELADIMRWLIAVIALSHITIGVWAGTQSFPFKEQFLRPLWKEDKSVILNLISIYLLTFIFWQILYYLKIPLAQRKSKSSSKDSQKKSKKRKRK